MKDKRKTVIFTYSDKQAVEDGVLVEVNRHDRVTRKVWDWLVEKQPQGELPPSGWPVDEVSWKQAMRVPGPTVADIMGADYDGLLRDRKALELARGFINAYQAQAREVYEKNLGGGIFQRHAVLLGQQIAYLGKEEFSAKVQAQCGRRLWLLPNEKGGVTLMFPEDY
jgi:hypothetical protein